MFSNSSAEMSAEPGGQNLTSTIEQNQPCTVDEPDLPPLVTSTGRIMSDIQVDKDCNGQSALDDEV